ncbi:hypothetical protein BpHYR1_016377 [Brachionus plicatilis]|uniref:Uncharacterized protein n=1 Tax=Brachionus plicatilis TaxID=10195 RepID=A0A3M7SWP5_BRAPC|nr:hypothetical protein BpHYR1_016377 [Brachionus plicatilis]
MGLVDCNLASKFLNIFLELWNEAENDECLKIKIIFNRYLNSLSTFNFFKIYSLLILLYSCPKN